MKDEEIARETMVKIGALLPSPWTPKGESEVISLLQAAFAKRKCPECAVLRTLSCVHGNKMDVCDICLWKPEASAEASELCLCYTYMDGDTDPDCPMHGTHGKSILRSKPEAPADNVKATAQKDGIALIAAERQRQLLVECWTAEHDDSHRGCQMVMAAACYALPHGMRAKVIGWLWPWAGHWYKPGPNRIRELEKAGALIAAEIDRLLRKESSVLDGNDAGAAPVNQNPPAPVSPQLPSGMEEIAKKCAREVYAKRYQKEIYSIILRAMQQAVEAAQKETNEERYTATKYFELIYAVESKYEGESRHQTALRYIQDRERRPIDQCGSTEKANP